MYTPLHLKLISAQHKFKEIKRVKIVLGIITNSGLTREGENEF
jgi:hypothetical protein